MNDDGFHPNISRLSNIDHRTLQNQMDFTNVPGTSVGVSGGQHIDAEMIEPVDEDVKQRILSLMAVNKIYMDFVGRLVLRVDRAIERNRELQQSIKSSLLSHKRLDDVTRSVSASLSCYPPYFRDMDGMAPRHNKESLKIMEICDVDPLLPTLPNWTERELQKLREAVHNSLYEIAIVPLNSKKEILSEKLLRTGIEDVEKRKMWMDEIERINRRIFYLKSRPDEELVKDNYNEVDWAKVSATDFDGTRSVSQLKTKYMNELLPGINNGEWTPEEDERLLELIRGPWLNWDVIADELGTGRTAFRCFEHSKLITNKRKGTWTVEEDEKLESLVDTLRVGDEIPWQKIAAYIPNRDKKDCQVHYERYLNRRLKHGRWNMTEDLVLLICVNKYGPQDWGRIAGIIQNRSAHQCRDRFINVLDEKRRKEPWLWEEHERLFCGIRVFGQRNHSKIALLLPGRNHVDVKSRIRALLRYHLAKAEYPNGSNHARYRNVISGYRFNKQQYDEVIKKFNQFSDIISQFDKSGQQIDTRTGIGSFLRSPDGKPLDYTLVKQMVHTEFGKWVCKTGRWTTVLTNPNEFGRGELEKEMRKLPLEKQIELEGFLRDSDVRYTIERTREVEFLKSSPDPDMQQFYDFSKDENRMARLDELIDTHLSIEAQDWVNYHKYKFRAPKVEKVPAVLNSVKDKPDGRKNPNVNIMRKRRTPAALMTSGTAPKRCLTASCRFIEEVRRAILAVPPQDRRLCIIRNLCEYIHRGDEITNIKHFERSGLKIRGLRCIQEYLAMKVHADEDVMKKVILRSLQGTSKPIVGHGNMIRITTESGLSRLVQPSAALFENYALNNPRTSDFPLREVLSNVLPPCISSLNAAVLLNRTRSELLLISSRLFDVVDPETLTHRPFKKDDECLDIRLSPQILNSPEYINLKKRIYRILFLPILMHKAIAQKKTDDLRQRQRLAISQRVDADMTFVQAFLKNKELHNQTEDTSSTCNVFKTYDNEGNYSLENERAADVYMS